MFLPIVKTVLPYINALAIALQRLFAWFGNLIGIDISDISTSIGGADISGILDQTDELSDNLRGVAANAKKAKAGIRAFDELKTISMPEDSKSGGVGAGGIGGGLLDTAFEDAFSKYQETWDKAFGNLENKAQQLADKIEKAFAPIKKIIRDFKVGDFFQAGKDVSKLVTSIVKFFTNAIKKVNWFKIGQNIGKFLAGIDWLRIFRSVGELMWEALKAAFELFVGAFSTAPLETAVISLVAFPKLLEKITSSKFVTGIGNLWKNFKIWGEKIQLVAGALVGNKAAVSGLSMLYPELGAKVEAVKTAFSNFFTSVKNNGFWKTLDSGITNIRNNLGGLQKAAIVAVAGFAEFSVVSSSVENLTLGTGNLLAEIGKIVGVVAIAAAAMYTALGPAGLVITAIVGVVAAIKGINDAFDTIRVQEIGESIKNVMSNPGGTPLSDITAQFSEAIGKIGDSFTIITEKSAGLEQADSNIRDTWLEIEKIETAMNAGVLSVDEGTEKLTGLFGQLAETASDKFGALETTLLAAFGENGVLNEVFNRLGISTENTTATIIQLNDKVEKRIEELTKLLAETDPSNPEYATYKEELAGLMAQTDDLTKAVSDYDFALKQIDYSDLFDEETGEFQIDKLQGFLDELSAATETANTNVETAIENTRRSLEEEKSLAESVGDWAAAEEIQEKIDVLPEALNLLKGDIALKATELTNTMQLDFIDGLNGVIEDAKTEWEEKNPLDKAVSIVFSAKTEGEYVKEAVDKQIENIGQISSAIETSFGELGINGAGWGSEALEETYSSLFDTEKYQSTAAGQISTTVTQLSGNWKEILDQTKKKASELAKKSGVEIGNNSVDGCVEGLTNEERLKKVIEASKGIADITTNTICLKLGISSPSKETEKLGKYTVEGYNQGISNNDSTTEPIISTWLGNLNSKFSSWILNTKESLALWSTDTTNKFGEWSRNTTGKFSTWETQSKGKIQRFGNDTTRSISSWSSNTSSKIGNWQSTNLNKISTWALNSSNKISGWKGETQSTIQSWKNETTNSVSIWSNDIEGKFQAWSENTRGTTDSWYGNMQTYFQENKWNFSGISNGLSTAFNSAIDSVKRIWNSFANWLNEKLTWNIEPIKVFGKTIFDGTTISLGKIPTFAAGGFPEDGWFRASHGEIMGQFDNGQSVVANNMQITEGIAAAVYPAVYNAVSSAMRNNGGAGNGNIAVQIELDGDVVYKNVLKRTKEQMGAKYAGRLVLADELY